MQQTIDLNADLGEGCADDAALMAYISSCNIACGGHAGDAASMTAALRLAKQNKVSAGAHPSYPDPDNFGRRVLEIPGAELRTALANQVSALKAVAMQEGVSLTHLKPHGALYNQATCDTALATLIAQLTAETLPGAALVGPPNSALANAAAAYGLAFIGEGFADRAYTETGTLVPRDQPGAVLETDQQRTRQALIIACEGEVETHDDKRIPLLVRTICLHGDSPGALASAGAIHAALMAAGFEICAPALRPG